MRRPPTHRVLFLVGSASLIVTIGLWVQSSFFSLRLNAFAQEIFALQITSSWGYVRVASIWPTTDIPWTLNIDWWDNGGMEKLKKRSWYYLGEIVLRSPSYERLPPNFDVPGQQGFTSVVLPYWIGTVFFGGLVMLAYLFRRRWRRIHGLCVRCGYDIRTSGKCCPECGKTIASTTGRLTIG